LHLTLGAKWLCSLRFGESCTGIRLFFLLAKQFVLSLSDGSLYLVTLGQESMTALPLGSMGKNFERKEKRTFSFSQSLFFLIVDIGHSVASAFSLISTVPFKQGACHLVDFLSFFFFDLSFSHLRLKRCSSQLVTEIRLCAFSFRAIPKPDVYKYRNTQIADQKSFFFFV